MRFKIETSSLQFRLIFGIIMIFTLESSIFTIWIVGKLKQVFLSTDQQDNLLIFIENLPIVSFLSIISTIVISSLFIWRSLLPLRRINQWATEPYLTSQQWLMLPREIKKIVQQIQLNLNKLSEVRQQQQEFINNVAHELRTPLSMIYGYLKRTQQQSHNLTDSQEETLAMAVVEAEQMTKLLQNLIQLARADNQTMPHHLEILLLNDLVFKVAQMMEKFEHRTILITLSSLPLRVKADRNQLMDVVTHLIKNALQYSDQSEPVKIEVAESDGWAVIKVSDRGCGISLSEQSRIFDPFYRVEASRARGTGGAGLGLSIVKSLVENMGGKITVESKPEEGSIFILTLPNIGAKS